MPSFYRGAGESGEEVMSIGGKLGLYAGSMGNATATVFVSFVFSLAFAGFVAASRERLTAAEILVPASIGMIVLVPTWTYRYVLPLAPFLFFYLVRGTAAIVEWIGVMVPGVARDRWRVARIAILCVIALDLRDHTLYVLAARDPVRVQTVDWLADAREVDEVLGWMRDNVSEPGGVATTNPALVYLVTARKTVAIDDFEDKWDDWKRRGIKYLVCLRQAELPTVSRPYMSFIAVSGTICGSLKSDWSVCEVPRTAPGMVPGTGTQMHSSSLDLG